MHKQRHACEMCGKSFFLNFDVGYNRIKKYCRPCERKGFLMSELKPDGSVKDSVLKAAKNA